MCTGSGAYDDMDDEMLIANICSPLPCHAAMTMRQVQQSRECLLPLLDQVKQCVHERGSGQPKGPARTQRSLGVAHEQPQRVHRRVRDGAAAVRHQRRHRLKPTLVANKLLRTGAAIASCGSGASLQAGLQTFVSQWWYCRLRGAASAVRH